jgi:hypothetical protein
LSDAIIQAAIEGRLKTWAAAQTPPISINYPNTGFKPAPQQKHLRGALLPADPLNPSVGGQYKHYHGIYQVDVCIPDGTGTGDATALTGALQVLFKCPTTIVKDGINVNILHTPATAPGASNGAGFYVVPVSIRYDADSFV